MVLHLRAGDSHEPALTIAYDGDTLTMGATSVPFALESGETLRLHLFVDRSVAELFVNDGRLAITTVQSMPTAPLVVEIDPQNSPLELRSFSAWELGSIH